MSGFTFTSASEPLATYTIKAANIYGTKEFVVEKATIIPVAMLIDWLSTQEFSLQKVYEAREDLNPQYNLEDGEDIDHLQAIDEIEAFYWLFKLAHDTKQNDLCAEVGLRFLEAIRIGNPWLVGDLWERLDDVYPSHDVEREVLHRLTATIVKKMTLTYRHQTELKPCKRTYDHGHELAQDQIYFLEWKIAQMCWTLNRL